MYYDDEYENYYEPSVIDEIGEKFKEELITHLKQEIVQEIKNRDEQIKMLKQNNEETRQELNKLHQEKREYWWKVEELERTKESIKRELEQNFLKLKYNDVIKKFGETVYRVDNKAVLKDKCEFCDKERKYTFNTPDGKTHEVKCSCWGHNYKYVAKEESLLRITLVKVKGRDLKLEMYYQEGCEDKEYDSGAYVSEIYDTFKESNDKYRAYYKTQEEAQKHCDYLNSKGDK